MKKRRKVELLAPAGGPEQLRAAVENGADAVYLGGSKFNARMHAANFDEEGIRKAVQYAHPRGVKLYAAVNTLLFDEEMTEALAYCADLYEAGIDALIVQDFGLARLVKKHIPDLPLHLSTQGTVYNLSGALAAARLGFCRVVPARELSLDAISDIAQNSGLEVEVFCHGALCMCYSGQCQLSRSLGGRSANRGACAQPCRLAYTDAEGNTGHFLSPKDLCTLEQLPALLKAGVSSLKIEGRMKSPEYTAIVTGLYRKYLDRWESGASGAVDPEDMKALQQVFSRSGFTQGYLFGAPKEPFRSLRLPGHAGIEIGRVQRRGPYETVDVRVQEAICLGDRIEIFADDRQRSQKAGAAVRRGGNLVTYVKELKNGILRIGDIKGELKAGDRVFRTVDAAQMEAARRSYARGSRNLPVSMTLHAHLGSVPRLQAAVDGALHSTRECTAEGSTPVEPAAHQPAEVARVAAQLQKTGDTPFRAERLRIFMDEGIYLPASAVNALRRDVLTRLEEQLAEGRLRPQVPAVADSLPAHLPALPCDALRLPPVTYGALDQKLKELRRHDDLPAHVCVENLGWIIECKEQGCQVYGGAGLNVTNEQARQALADLGVIVTALSRECMASPDLLMVTEYPLKEGILTDGKGRRFLVRRSAAGDKTEIRRG
ncbi:MAG: U32 family peptidase [Eubacteriales bacterium]|nr:U32 family peptidase [Eubacteriales bacterium]